MSILSKFSINDDKGNPIIGPKRVGSPSGEQKGNFTPEAKFKNDPDNEQQLGVHIDSTGLDPSNTDDRLKSRKNVYSYFNDNSGLEFIHGLDTFPDGSLKIIPQPQLDDATGAVTQANTTEIYLGSFIQTDQNNEDPTIYGYDITINSESSPLFNGAVEDFINSNSAYTEISSRLPIINSFKEAILNFFKNNTPLSSQSSTTDNTFAENTRRHDNPKTYYLRKISGLENLVEQRTGFDKGKSFIKYGEDIISLALYEDVSMNMGYIAMLYKSLAWSRINGKELIPPNLLRFDAEIVITEIRKYNRVIKGQDKSLSLYSDLLSKYRYKLYECQFFFPKFPHGSEISMIDPKVVEDFDVVFNYKFSTLKMERFNFNGTQASTQVIDNEKNDLLGIKTSETNNVSTSNNTITASSPTINLTSYDEFPRKTINESNQSSSDSNAVNGTSTVPSINDIKTNDKKSKLKTNLNVLKKKVANAFVAEANRQISQQARLLNKTLDNIRNSAGIGRMSPPTNVYESNPLKNDIQNALRNFAGKSVKGFFTP